ncbi:hypothetical protein BDV41DRAFT_578473 [Aspergillus transmontanensis]|uniref:HNH nuclease domain-containing protein n=1 Tax=Aspergillus transmontanensis TaxID=1034304 RepID=A0A5N6VWW7_9EURO|nr:hypothetical protein BDV41DRAFT_578473 [Aspergillus transmontanensis]
MNAAPEFDQAGRLELIKKISESAGASEIDSVTWAFLWLADISRLEPLAQYAKNPDISPYTLSYLRRDYYPALKDWLCRFRNTNAGKRKEPPTEEPAPDSSTRSAKAADDAAKRDQHKCIVTKAGEPIDIAHLVSFSLGLRHQRRKEREEFWGILTCFWSTERIKRWQSAVLENGTETAKNLLSLTKDVHRLFDTARFALRPVTGTETELELEFYWMPGGVRQDVNPSNKPIVGHYRNSAKKCKLMDYDSEEVITSGHVIKIITSNPENLPLPSFDVLEMQWYLHRVAAISGAADFVEEPDDDDNDDDDDVEEVELAEHPTPGVVGRTIEPIWPRISDPALHQQENQPTTLSVRRRQQSPGKTRDSSSTRSSPVRRALE